MSGHQQEMRTDLPATKLSQNNATTAAAPNPNTAITAMMMAAQMTSFGSSRIGTPRLYRRVRPSHAAEIDRAGIRPDPVGSTSRGRRPADP
jgi:hypothetical protein